MTPTWSKSSSSTHAPSLKLTDDRSISKSLNLTMDHKAHVGRTTGIAELEKEFNRSKRNCDKYEKRIKEYQACLEDFTSRITSLESEFFGSIKQCENLVDMLVSVNRNADKQISEQKKVIGSLEAQVSRLQEAKTRCEEEEVDFTELFTKLDACINVLEKEPQITARYKEVEHKEVQTEAQGTVNEEEFAKVIKQGQGTKGRPRIPIFHDTELYTYQADAPILAGHVWTVMTMIVVYVYSASL